MVGVLVILATYIACFTEVGVNGNLVIDTPSGCVDVTVNIPYEFKAIRVDQTDYDFKDGECVNRQDPLDVIECSLIENCLGGFIGKARVCNVERKTWTGFYVSNLLGGSRFAYVSVYFSHNGTWTGIDKNCIQPQLSGPTVFKAGGLNEVEIVCARKMDCPMGPFTTIMTKDQSICSDYGAPLCEITENDDIKYLRAVIPRPDDGDRTFAFCSTGDTFLSYDIDWGTSA
uniref:CUB domain-containing protein n=1 Tax=Mesocestoides corti TaxID=53468 RepID=A0A5K3F9L7_MESCO